MKFIVFACLLAVVAAQSQQVPKKTEPKFLEILNSPTTTIPPTSTVNVAKVQAEKKRQQDEKSQLNDALLREQDLKKQLVEARNAMAAKSAFAGAPSAAAVVPVPMALIPAPKPSERAVEVSTTVVPAIIAAVPVQDSVSEPSLAAKLLGSNGLLSLLNPRIMDQQEAATKLIPALDTNPSIQAFQQRQMGLRSPTAVNPSQPSPNPQLDARQLPFGGYGQPASAYPSQPQMPIQNTGLYPQTFQQPNQFGGFGNGQLSPSPVNTQFLPQGQNFMSG